MRKLYINDQLCDLFGDESIAHTLAANKFQDIKSRQGNFSNEFELPMTNNNLTIIDNCHQVNTGSDFDKRLGVAKIYEDGVLTVTGYAQLNEVKDTIKMVVFSGNSDWISLVGDKLMQDLDVSDMNHTFDNATVDANRNNLYTTGWVYPNCLYGAFAFPGTPFTILDFYPCIYDYQYLMRIFNEVGYTVDGSLLDDALFLKMVRPFTNLKMYTAASFDSPLALTSASTLDIAGMTLTAPTILSDFIGLSAPAFDPMPMVVPGSTTPTIGAAAYFNTGADNTYNFVVTLNFTATGGGGSIALNSYDNTGAVVALGFPESYVNGANSLSFTISNVNLLKDQKVVFRFQVSLPTLGSIGSMSGTISFNTYNNYSVSNNTYPGSTVDMNQCIPEGVRQKDFILDLFNRFDVLCTVNQVDKIVYLNKFSDLLTNIPNAVYMTEFVDHTENVTVVYDLESYAKRNWFRNAQDSNDVIIPFGYGDGYIDIDKDNLQPETNVFESKFAPVAYQPGIASPVIRIREPYQKLNAKVAYIELQSSNIIEIDTMPPLATNAQLYFENLRFDTSLIPTYYPAKITVLQNYKLIKIDLRLNCMHIQALSNGQSTTGLSFVKPVFINTTVNGNNVTGYFYLNEVTQYKSGENESTQVQIVPIL